MDFTNERNSYLCRFAMAPVGPGSPPYPSSAQWAEPDLAHAAELMRHVFDNPDEAAQKGSVAAAELAAQFNPERCAAAVKTRWDALRSQKLVAKNGRTMPEPSSARHSAPVKSLRKEGEKPLDVDKAVPSLGTIFFQGPRKILRKVLERIERQRKPFDDAVIATASDHDKRIALLEKSIAELREQNAALLRANQRAEDQSSTT
jgi:hypothetical protein